MKALVVAKTPTYTAQIQQLDTPTLSDGEVLIRSQWSSLNYKDALGITGKGAILKSFPMVPGIDVAGVIESSRDKRFREGDSVVITGCGLGESFNGGYSTHVRAAADVVVNCPKNLSLKETMILGTAGFTAALALWRMEQLGQTPAKGPIVVTGASGGVGSLAVQIFSSQGYEVIAVSGKKDLASWLRELGAKEVVTEEELKLGSRPLESGRFGGVVDNVGGELLSKLFAHVTLWGNVACIGLAASAELHTTVMPLILRGVSFLGVSSNNCEWPVRQKIWDLLAGDWRIRDLEQYVLKTVSLDELIPASQEMIGRKTHGRMLVKL